MHEHVYQIVGHKNTGKTTLICRLIEKFTETGIRVGVVKHDAHEFDTDHPGTDTWKQRKAGAQVVAIASKNRTSIIRERSTSLRDLIAQIIDDVDIILVEGYKYENYPKLLMIRTEEDIELIKQINNVKAVASWIPKERFEAYFGPFPFYSIDDTTGIFQYIRNSC